MAARVWQQHRRKLKKIGPVLLLVIGLCLFWWFRYVAIVSTGDALVEGTVINVNARGYARLEELLVKEGDQVKVGQVIAKLDSKELEAKVLGAKANLAVAQAKLASMQADKTSWQVQNPAASLHSAAAELEKVKKSYDALKTLYNQGILSAQEMIAAQAELDIAQAQYQTASQQETALQLGPEPQEVEAVKLQVAQGEEILKNAQQQFEQSNVIAPANGEVVFVPVQVGQKISVGQIIARLVDSQAIWVYAVIDKDVSDKVHEGQQVEFTVEAFPGRVFIGKVQEMGERVNSHLLLENGRGMLDEGTESMQKVSVKIAVSDENHELRPGMPAVVHILVYF